MDSRTMTKRTALARGAAWCSSGLAAACVPQPPWAQPGQGSGPAAGQLERATISYAFWETGAGLADRARARADDFEARHAGAKIELLVWPYQEYLDKLQVMYASDSGPDTVLLDMPIVQQYAKAGVFTNLLPLAKADREVKLAEIPPLLVEVMSGRKDNALLGLPSGAGPNLFYYNRALLDAAGKPTPQALYRQDRWSWDAFLDLARATTRRPAPGQAPSGQLPAAQSAADQWEVAGCVPGLTRCWLATNGAAEFDDMRAPTKCLYDTPPAIDALTYVAELYRSQRVAPLNVAQALGDNDINAFAAGRLTLNARWTPPIGVYRRTLTFRWGLAPYPKGRGQGAKPAYDIGTSGIAIAKRTKAPNPAWAWAKFTVDEQGQLLEVKQSGGSAVPLNRAAQEAAIQELRTIPLLETPEMTIELMRKGGGVVRLLSVNQNEINAIITEEMAKLLRGESGAAVAARQIATRVNQFLRENPQ